MKQASANGIIVLAFVVALEIVIMISPFAMYFYAVFNPFLLALSRSPTTGWLTAFFLPHMVVPPDTVLTVIRILGSVLFVVGLAGFLACAVQVYGGKLLRKGAATKFLYAVVRHPQYVSLGFAAAGLAIMWPRFLTLVLLAIMLFFYYILARDEERRMTNRFCDDYRSYLERTGMFVPRFIEKAFGLNHQREENPSVVKASIIFLALVGVIVGGGFLLRAYTVHHLLLQQVGNIDVIVIAQDDVELAKELLPRVVEDSAVSLKLHHVGIDRHHRILAYFIPVDYVMQGMIANTGEEWKIFQHRKTFEMIVDFILHPFAHLTEGHAHHMASLKHGPEMYNSPTMKRRVIFLEISSDSHELASPVDDFAIDGERTPLFYADVHLHTAEILAVQDTPRGSGWGTVPTPMF